MKKKYLIIYAVLFLKLGVSEAQYIKAGQHTLNDYFHNFNPALVINTGALLDTTATYLLDLNGDSTPDFKIINRCNCGALGESIMDININALSNSNKVAFSHLDSCTGTQNRSFSLEAMAFPFSYADTIKNSGGWRWDDTLTFRYNWYDQIDRYCGLYIPDTSYIGFRLINNSDTLFGWLLINLNGYSKITLQDYACNLKPTGINELSNYDFQLKISPNPSFGNISIQTTTQSHPVQITLFSLLGQTVTSCNPPVSLSYSIDVSDLPKAIYIVQVQDILTREVGRQKIVVQ